MKKWLALLVLCLAYGLVLLYNHKPDSLESFKPAFLTITFTVVTFSVMFSLAGFNASAYRQFHRTVAPRLLAASVFLFVLALVPLGVLVLVPSYYIATCLLLLPCLAIAGIALLEIGRKETDPSTLLDRLCSVKTIEHHLLSLVPQIRAKIEATKMLGPEKPEGMPTHEFDWHLPVQVQEHDPLNALATLGLLAIQHDDLYAFSRVIARSLEAFDHVELFTPPKSTLGDYKIRAAFRAQVYSTLHRLVVAVTRERRTVSLAHVAVDTLATFVASKTAKHEQTHDTVFSSLYLMETLSRYSYDSDSHEEIRAPLVLARQIIEKGMDELPGAVGGKKNESEERDFNFRLPQLSKTIKHIGTFAIENGDSNLLYRCFDAFGWLGCAAVRHKNGGVATACLRGLSQLGREVRVKKLECHWDACAIRPEDHAAERIDWIGTWLATMPREEQDFWIESLNCAYSRLSGKRTKAHIEVGGSGRPFVRREVSDKNYVESYSEETASRLVDYSDFTFLKDLELHGYMEEGVVMARITTPLVFGENQAVSTVGGE